MYTEHNFQIREGLLLINYVAHMITACDTMMNKK